MASNAHYGPRSSRFDPLHFSFLHWTQKSVSTDYILLAEFFQQSMFETSRTPKVSIGVRAEWTKGLDIHGERRIRDEKGHRDKWEHYIQS